MTAKEGRDTRELMEKTLRETVAFYSEDPCRRASDVSDDCRAPACRYETEDGRHCAVGRLMTEEQLYRLRVTGSLTAFVGDLEEIFAALPGGTDVALLDNGMPMFTYPFSMFLRILQPLHDGHEYWDANGITQSGLNKVRLMCEKFDLRPSQAIPNPIPRPQATTKETT